MGSFSYTAHLIMGQSVTTQLGQQSTNEDITVLNIHQLSLKLAYKAIWIVSVHCPVNTKVKTLVAVINKHYESYSSEINGMCFSSVKCAIILKLSWENIIKNIASFCQNSF